VWPWARGVPRNLRLPFNIFATAEASDFKFGTAVGFVKAHQKITEEKWGCPWVRQALQNLGVAL